MLLSILVDLYVVFVCSRFKSFKRRDLSLFIAWHQSLDVLKISDTLGLWAGIRQESGRFVEVQSRINWVRISGVRYDSWRISFVGCICTTVFKSSGYSRSLTSDKALHVTMMCSMLSTEQRQSWQAGLREGWLLASSSLHRISQVRNFRWLLSFFASWVFRILRRMGWGWPASPHSCTFRYFIFLFFIAAPLSSFSCHTVTLVLTRLLHSSLVMTGQLLLSNVRGGGRPYLRQRSWTWLDHVVELLLHICRMYLVIVWTVELGLLTML